MELSKITEKNVALLSAIQSDPQLSQYDEKDILALLRGAAFQRGIHRVNILVRRGDFNRENEIETFLTTVGRKGNKSEHTLRAYRRALDYFCKYVDAIEIHILDIARPAARKFVEKVYIEFSEQSTRAAYIAPVRALFNYLMNDSELIDKNPFSSLKMTSEPAPEKSIEVLTAAEIETLFNYMQDQEQASGRGSVNARRAARSMQTVAKALLATGIRAGALCSFTFGQSLIRYKSKGKKGEIKAADFPELTPELFAEIKALNVKEWTAGRIQKYLQRAGIAICKAPDKFHAHAFRHVFAKTLYNRTKDIIRTRDALNHSSVKTTEIYLRNIGADL